MFAERFAAYGMEMPVELRDSLVKYGRLGRPTGSFLRAVLANDLVGAIVRADPTNLTLLPVIAAYVVNELPDGCRGSYGAVDEWIVSKRRALGAGSD